MNEYPYNFGRGGAVTSAETRNRVLRNTYWLLALSMVPTVLGAWVGVATGFSPVLSFERPWGRGLIRLPCLLTCATASMR